MMFLSLIVGDMHMGQTPRAEVPKQDTWNVASMYQDLASWQND